MNEAVEKLRGLYRREGFTLLEVSVAVTLSLLIAGLAYGTYVFSSRVVEGGKQHVRAENELHLFARRFSQEVRAARGVYQETEHELTLYHGDSDEVTYRWEEEQLLRNDVPVQLANLEVGTGTFIVQQGEERLAVALQFPVRFPEIVVSAVPRDVRIGVTTRLPLDWSDAADAPFDTGNPPNPSFDTRP